jgi:hypothetical protein
MKGTMKNDKPATCTWAINHFPRALKNKYAAFVKSNGATMRDHIEYLLLKTMREAGVGDTPRFELDDLIKRMTNKSKGGK